MLKGRTLNSDYRWEWHVSNPTTSDDLLDRLWKSEYCDQKLWHIKCSRCNHWQVLNYDGLYGFKGNVCKERQIFVCQRCDEPLRTEDRIDGAWVPTYESRQKKDGFISGYWMHQLLRHNCNVPELIYEEQKDMQTFMNMYMGMPYNGTDLTASSDVIKKNTIPPITLEDNVVMGLDTGYGTGHHYVIGSDNVVFKMGIAQDFDEVEALMAQYKVKVTIVDNGPETENANKLAEKYPGKVLKNYYNQHMHKEEVKYIEEESMVHSARHRLFDRYIRSINKDVYKFAYDPRDPIFNRFCDHFSSLSCVVELDKSGNPQIKWKAPTESTPDHFAHAFLYWRLAVERLKYLTPQYKAYNSDDLIEKRVRQDMEAFFRTTTKDEDWYNL